MKPRKLLLLLLACLLLALAGCDGGMSLGGWIVAAVITYALMKMSGSRADAYEKAYLRNKEDPSLSGRIGRALIGSLWDRLTGEVGHQPQQEIMLVKGARFIPGVLTLTGEALWFRPINTVDKLVGAQDLKFSFDEIEGTRGTGESLFIVIGGETTEFQGRGAGDILEELDRLLAQQS